MEILFLKSNNSTQTTLEEKEDNILKDNQSHNVNALTCNADEDIGKIETKKFKEEMLPDFELFRRESSHKVTEDSFGEESSEDSSNDRFPSDNNKTPENKVRHT